MDKNSNGFTVAFASAVCIILAIALSSTYTALKGRIEENAQFDKKRNVLIAMRLYDKADTTKTRADLEKLFAERVRSKVLRVVREETPRNVMVAGTPQTVTEKRVVDLEDTGKTVDEMAAELKVEARKPKKDRELVPLYQGVDENGKLIAWCIPIEGYGLWSTLYGFLALEADLRTVRGITFYKHGETPGLGGEVDNPAWQAQWQGKQILDENGRLVGIKVKKGPVDPKVAFERKHMVDGLSGATITSNGVTRFIAEDLALYEPYFKKMRKR